MLSVHSCISSSNHVWRRWLAFYIGVALAAEMLALTFMVVIDPFSSGRFTPFSQVGITTSNRSFASAARVRDLRFDGAIFGTSTSILIEPELIGNAIGHHLVTMSIEGAMPPVHMYLMDRFASFRRRQPVILILVIDQLWCKPQIPSGGAALPRWLHEGGFFDYVWNIMSPEAVRAAERKVLILLGLAGNKAPLNGYEGLEYLENPRRKRAMLTMSRPAEDVAADAPFPAFDELRRQLQTLSSDSVVLLVFPPAYTMALPMPGSAAYARLAACKAQARAIAGSLPRADVLDMRVDNETVRDAASFVDPDHYDRQVARQISQHIIERLRNKLSAAEQAR